MNAFRCVEGYVLSFDHFEEGSDIPVMGSLIDANYSDIVQVRESVL